jgi:MFS transporter, DHA2 family, multidrug resistance protein
MGNFLQREPEGGAVNPWLIAGTVMLATFMEVLDTSIANVALPHIAGNLSAGVDESTWLLTSYLVSNAIVLPLTGWFSTLFGRKRFYHGLCGGLHRQLFSLRAGAQPAAACRIPDSARRRGRRITAHLAGDPRGKL